MELSRYNIKCKWSSLIDYKSIVEKNYVKEYNNSQEDDKKTLNINKKKNFSLNNENILSEINDNLLIKDFKNYSSLELLEKQNLSISYINKLVQNNSDNFNFIIKNLIWLKNVSKELSHRLKLKIKSHKIELKKNNLVRSSYRFCLYKNNCNYNYNKKSNKCCYADHYVHNILYADIEYLIKYLNKFYKDTVINNKEVIKCITTIAFVIKHMYKELKELCYYIKNKKDHEKFHKVCRKH